MNAPRSRIRWPELVGSAALLAVLGAAAFGSHVTNGGFYSDDWAKAAVYATEGYGGAVNEGLEHVLARPLYAVLDPLRFALLGATDPLPHLVLAIALGLVTSLALYVLLRQLEFGSVAALLIAALALLYPWADSIRLWPTGSLNTIAVVLFLVGAIFSLRSFSKSGSRYRLLAAAGTAAFVASVLTYQATMFLALLFGVLYFLRAPAKRAALKWGADAAAVGCAAVYSAFTSESGHPLRAQIANAFELAWSSGSLAITSIVPSAQSTASRLVVAVVITTILATGAWIGWKGARESSSDIRRLVVIAIAAVVAVQASYVPFAQRAYWNAWLPGLENRVNVLASLPLVVFAYAVVALASRLIARIHPRLHRIPTALTVIVMLAIGSAYVLRVNDDKTLWARATTEADGVLAVIDSAVPNLPKDATIFTFGHRAEVAPGVHVFAASWDLWGAVKLRRDDATLTAHPALPGISFECNERGLSAKGAFYLDIAEDVPETRYGRVFFVDIPTGRSASLDDRRECLSAVDRFEPG
ncbi:MAG: hypothetical protein WD646_00220 [Actinomycetota bacterium]